MKWFLNKFTLHGLSVAIFWIIEVGVTFKMNILIALKSKSYILDLDHVKSSLGIFFFLSCLIESIFHQLSGSTFIFVKNTHQNPESASWHLCI